MGIPGPVTIMPHLHSGCQSEFELTVGPQYTLPMLSPIAATRPTARSRAACILLVLAALGYMFSTGARADGERLRLRHEESAPNPSDDAPRSWYIFAAAVNVYPRLESEKLVDRLLEPVLAGLAPGHDGVDTIGDLRDAHLLWPPHVGLGLNLNEHWSIFVEAGYTAGKVRTKSDRTSVFLLPLHTDFEIFRSALFTGVGVDYFPWGMPPQTDYDSLGSRLAHVRPFFGSRLTWTYATYRAKVKVGLRPFPNIVNLELSDAWGLPSATVVAGVDVPLTRNTTLTFNAGYNYFWEQASDFEGYAFTIQIRRYINGPQWPQSGVHTP